MQIIYQIEVDDQVAADFAIGLGLETVDPLTGEELVINVQEFLENWLRSEVNRTIKDRVKQVFTRSAKLKAEEDVRVKTSEVEVKIDLVLG